MVAADVSSVFLIKGIGIAGQPRPQLYFHRSLTDLLSPFLAAGLVVDGIDEPTFPPEIVSDQPFAWENYREIPPVLAVRWRTR